MHSRTHIRLGSMLLGAALMLVGRDPAQAATLASGPLLISAMFAYTCAAQNIGTKSIDVVVTVSLDGGALGATANCPALSPTSVCSAATAAGSDAYRYCTITTNNKRNTRGAFCNTTAGTCVPAQ